MDFAGLDVNVTPAWVRSLSGNMQVESDAAMNARMAGDFSETPALQAYANAMRRMRSVAPDREFSQADLYNAVSHILQGSSQIHGIPPDIISEVTGTSHPSSDN